MKVKIKDKSVPLPNAWKSCGVSIEEWEELQAGKEIEMSSIPEHIEPLIEIKKSPSKQKEGDE
tara:strand:- start:86 stop:274 length:189 start_codon:yes stop_codon:yes gene_type:complete